MAEEGFHMPKYETTLVTDRRIYSTSKPIRSHIVLKEHYHISQKAYNDALHAVYSPESDFLSLTEDSDAYGEKFGRLYDFLAAKYPGFGMGTRIRTNMWAPEQRVGEVYHPPTHEFNPDESGAWEREEMRERLLRGQRRPVKVRSHLRRRIVDHLEHPPSYCMCHRSKTVDRARRGLIRRLK